MAATPKPWEQRADESTSAYEAFKVYRDLGAERTIDAAGLIISPPEEHGAQGGAHSGRKRGATGRIRTYAKDFDWANRAGAYDRHQASVLQKGVDKATERQGREWAERRDRAYRDLADRWEKRLRQSDIIAAMPLVRQTIERDGEHVTLDPATVLDHYRAVQMASRAQQRLVEVLDRGLALETKDAEQTASETMPVQGQAPPGAEPDAPNELEAWRAYQRVQILKMDTGPPEDSSGSPYYKTNGANERT